MANTNLEAKHIDVYLTNFIQKYTVNNIAAEFFAPSFKVKRTSDKYLIHGKDNHRIFDDTIGRREPIREIEPKASDGTYRCVEHGVAGFVYNKDQQNVEKPIRLKEEKTEYIKERKEANRSFRVLAIAANTALVPFTAIASAWNTPASSVPVNNILDGMGVVENAIAKTPNAIGMTYQVALKMIQSAQWKDYFKFTGKGYETGLFSAISGLKELGLDPMIIPDRGVSSYDGCASDPDWETMLGDKVIIFHREPKPTTQTNTFMFSPYTTKDEVRRFYKEEQRGWKFTIQDEIDELLVNADAAYILNDVL